MKAITERWSVVLVGAWNTAIFTPDWLTKLMGVSNMEVQIEFPIANPLLAVRYTFQNVRMVTHRDRLVLAPMTNDDAVLERVEFLTKAILRTLTHTPITSLGINLEFVEDDIPELLKIIFPREDVPRIAAEDFIVGDTEVRRDLRRSQGQDEGFRLVLRRSDSGVTIRVNFHKDVADTTVAGAYLEGRVLKCRDLALRFLKDVYGLEQEETA